MKTILYATDYLDHSVSTLHYANELSKKIKARLIVLHIFDIPTFSGVTMIKSAKQTHRRAREENYSILETYCKKHLGNDFEDTHVKIMVARNMSITDEILYQSKQQNADIVMVGVKDENSRRGFLVGDIAKTLIKESPYPVLVVQVTATENK